MIVKCWADDCIHNENCECKIGYLTISDEMECTDYQDYRKADEYQTEFYRAWNFCGSARKKLDHGKRGELNGIVFFYQDKQLKDYTRCIEETSGREFAYKVFLSEKLLDELKKAIPTYPNVRDLPDFDE